MEQSLSLILFTPLQNYDMLLVTNVSEMRSLTHPQTRMTAGEANRALVTSLRVYSQCHFARVTPFSVDRCRETVR